MRVIEISSPLGPSTPAFPGDPPVTLVRTHSIARGDAYNVSALSMGTHAGTHVDPPVHFLPDGATIDRIDLSALNGPCTVVQLPAGALAIDADVVERLPPGTERVLFRTRNSERWKVSEEFFPDYVALAPSAAEALAARGARLVGIDALSIENDATGRYPVHHALLSAGVLILEGLRLSEAPPGAYDLRCLPLRLHDGDGGPARAVLVRP